MSQSTASSDDEEPKYVPDDSMFTSPGPMSDVTLRVEDRVLHVSRCVLSLSSSVFRKMLEGEFKEQSEIPLVDKKYNDIVELLLCIYPSTSKKVTRETWETVLPLADQYGIESIKSQCEKLLVDQLQFDERYKRPSTEELAHFLYISDKYKLEKMFSVCITKAEREQFDGLGGLKNMEDFGLMSLEAKFRVASSRITIMEQPLIDVVKFMESMEYIWGFETHCKACRSFGKSSAGPHHDRSAGCLHKLKYEVDKLSPYLERIMNINNDQP